MLIVNFKGRSRSTGEINLLLSFPEYSAQKRLQILKSCFVHLCQVMMELGTIWLRPASMLTLLYRGEYGTQAVQDAVNNRSGGTLILMPHLGNWELLPGYFLKRCGSTMHLLYTPPKSSFGRLAPLLLLFMRAREGLFQHAATRDGVRDAMRALHAGGTLLILPDQQPDEGAGSIETSFFALDKVPTITLAGRLATHAKAGIFIGHVVRVRGGFDIHFTPLDELRNMNVDSRARLVNRSIERVIEPNIDQYLWVYKRFKRSLYP